MWYSVLGIRSGCLTCKKQINIPRGGLTIQAYEQCTVGQSDRWQMFRLVFEVPVRFYVEKKRTRCRREIASAVQGFDKEDQQKIEMSENSPLKKKTPCQLKGKTTPRMLLSKKRKGWVRWNVCYARYCWNTVLKGVSFENHSI